ENATVALTPATGLGAFSPPREGAPFFAAARAATTKSDGSYEFSDLPVGAYRLYVRRLGYEAATLDVELSSVEAAQLSVGLTVVPIRLRAMRVQPSDSGVQGSADGKPGFRVATNNARIDAERLRQRTFLGTDVREITQPDIAEAATLGGSDLFRALQRLPGVGSYDDWATDLWIRGGRADQTRVYFDGLPFLNPLHALGTVSGIGSDAIGSAVLHPGVRPASVGGEGIAVLDLRSRSGGGSGKIRAAGGVASTDMGLSLDQSIGNGRASWMVAARSSVADVFPRIQTYIGKGLAYQGSFKEYVARGDLDLGGGRRLEASILRTNDDVTNRYNDSQLFESDWSNDIKRITLHFPFARVSTTHTLGKSQFTTLRSLGTLYADTSSVPRPFLSMNSVADLLMLSGEIRPHANGEPTWAAGYSVVTERAGFRAPGYTLMWNDLTNQIRGDDERLSYTTLWADRRWRMGSRVTVGAGLRADIGGRYIESKVRYAPSLQGRYSLDAATSLSVGIGRSHQYVQELPLLETSKTEFAPGTWLVAGREAPFIKNDQLNVGVERWTGAGILLTANAYARRSTGIAAPDPRPGAATSRPFFVPAIETTQGFELSARRLTGRVTGSIAYSLGHATRESANLTFAAPGDRRHALDATLMARLGSFRVGSAFAAMSGLPYTRAEYGKVVRDPNDPNAFIWERPTQFGPPNAQRFPVYASLDPMLDWTRAIRGVNVTVFAQVSDVLDRRNFMWYWGSYSGACPEGLNPDFVGCVGGDLLLRPVRPIPGLGVRIAF
ncbi:MAG TPA: TonB-dependent receptor, partial [Gemmatimonadaceae bacterium]